MVDRHDAFCHVCREVHPAVSVSDDEAAIIAEDAQDPADYYLMDEHVDSRAGKRCDGSGKAPESLTIEDEGYDISGDELPPEPIDWRC